MKEKEFEQVGVIGIDAGLCWIGDPCYCFTLDRKDYPAETWTEFCKKLEEHEKMGVMQWNYKSGHKGLGVSVSTGYGDGKYSVFVKRNSEGVISEVRVIFVDEDED